MLGSLLISSKLKIAPLILLGTGLVGYVIKETASTLGSGIELMGGVKLIKMMMIKMMYQVIY